MNQMGKKKRRRRLLVLMVLAIIVIWVGGCATGQSFGLSTWIPMSQKQPIDSTGSIGDDSIDIAGNSSAQPLPPDITDDVEPVTTPGDMLDSIEHTDLTVSPSHKPGGESVPTGDPTIRPTPTPAQEQDMETDEDTDSDSAGAIGKGPDKDTPGTPGKVKRKLVALTFDDGPDSRYTTEILDILKDKGVKATFFVVGIQVEKFPDIMKRIVEEGHAVGNHSYGHKDLSKLNRSQINTQVQAADRVIEDAIGYVPEMFRAPYGAVSPTLKKLLKEQERELVGWTVDTRDWAGTPIDEMREIIRNETKANGIILLHSFGSKHIANTVEMLPDVIDDLEKLGFTFVTADQLPQ